MARSKTPLSLAKRRTLSSNTTRRSPEFDDYSQSSSRHSTRSSTPNTDDGEVLPLALAKSGLAVGEKGKGAAKRNIGGSSLTLHQHISTTSASAGFSTTGGQAHATTSHSKQVTSSHPHKNASARSTGYVLGQSVPLPPTFRFRSPITVSAHEAQRANSSTKSATPTRIPSISNKAIEDNSEASTSSSSSPAVPLSQVARTLHSDSLEFITVPSRSLSPEIPIYIPEPSRQPRYTLTSQQPTDENGQPLNFGKHYFVGARPPRHSQEPIVVSPERAPISAYKASKRSARKGGMSTGKRGRPRKTAPPPRPAQTPITSSSFRPAPNHAGLPIGPVPIYYPTSYSGFAYMNVPGAVATLFQVEPPPYPSALSQPHPVQEYGTFPHVSASARSTQGLSERGKGKLPAKAYPQDVFDPSPMTSGPPSPTHRMPPDLGLYKLAARDVQDPNVEWYLDIATVTWETRPCSRASPSPPPPEPANNLPLVSSPPLRAQTPPRSISLSDSQLPNTPSSGLSYASVPIVRRKPLNHPVKAASSKQGTQISLSNTPNPPRPTPSQSYRRSPTIVPDSEDESEGRQDVVGGSGVNGRAASMASSIADHDVPLSAVEPPSFASTPEPEPAVQVEDTSVAVTMVQQTEDVLEQEVFVDITTLSEVQTAQNPSEARHVVDTQDVLEYQSQQILSAALREAIVIASLLSVPEGQPRLQFAGCYSVLIDPSMALNEEAVDRVAMALAGQTDITFRKADRASSVEHQEPTHEVVSRFECMCDGLQGPVGLPSPPSTSESDAHGGAPVSSCGGMLSIGITDVRAGFVRGMKVTVCARHP